jgi:hypothetical protein
VIAVSLWYVTEEAFAIDTQVSAVKRLEEAGMEWDNKSQGNTSVWKVK